MPSATLRMCRPGCSYLVGKHRPCPDHPRRAWHSSTASRQARGYGAEHDALRRRVAKEEPCCAACGSECVPWVMDHITPKHEGGQDVRENVQRLCPTCSKAKTAREAQRALRRAKVKYGLKMDAGRES